MRIRRGNPAHHTPTMKQKIKTAIPQLSRARICDVKAYLMQFEPNSDMIDVWLKRMHLAEEIQLLPADDPQEITQHDRDTAIKFGPETMYFVKLL